MKIPKATKTTSKELKRLHWLTFLQRQFRYDDLYGKIDNTLAQKKRRWRYEYNQLYNVVIPPIPEDTVKYNKPIQLDKKGVKKHYNSINSKALVYLKRVLATFENNTIFTVYHARDNSQIKLVTHNNVTYIKLESIK